MKEQLEALAKSLEESSRHLRAVIKTVPAEDLLSSMQLAPGTPARLVDLPVWLASLPFEQLVNAWVPALAIAVTEALRKTGDEEATMETGSLIRSLLVVRDAYDAACGRFRNHPLGPPDGGPMPDRRTGVRQRAGGRRSNIDYTPMLARARELAPNPGDAFVFFRAFPDLPDCQRQYLRMLLARSGDFLIRRSETEIARNGNPLIEAVRR